MNYYEEIKNKLIDVEVQSLVKDYSKNKYTLEKYYEIGKLLIEAQGGETRAKYGQKLVKEYAKKLSLELGKKYSYRSLNYMIRYYLFQKVQPVAANLSWSHYIELLSLKNDNEINYYINKCIQNNLSRNKLRELIKSKEYERLPNSTKNKLITKEEVNIKDTVPNPIIINNNSNKEVISEKLLQQLILDDIDSFLKQLGNGFTYIGHEYPIKLGDNYNYIDILLFNIEFNAYVVVELKVNEVKKQDIGQILEYVNYIDKNIKKEYHNNTIGIIVSRRNNEYIIEYCTIPNIMFRKYQLI